MCGRYVSATEPQKLAVQFAAEELRVGDNAPGARKADEAATGSGANAASGFGDRSVEPETSTRPARQIQANYNVAPTNRIFTVSEDAEGVRGIDEMRWGLVPSWAKDPKIGSRMINARAETVAEKNSYRKPFATRRALVPADGFYEWRTPKSGRRKQPFFIHALDGEPLAFAGLWDRWHDRSDENAPPLYTATIITTAANTTMRPVHDRMPAILPASAWGAWLDRENHDTAALQELLVPAADDLLEMYPVSTDVGRVSNNGPELLAEIRPDQVIA